MRLAYGTLCGLGLLAGCARGVAGVDDETDAGDYIDDMNGATASDGGDSGAGPSSNDGGDDDAGSSNAGSGSSGGGTTDPGDAGRGDASLSCPAPAGSCMSAQDLGELVGNTDGAALTASGSGSAWFRVTVRDDDSNGFVESAMGVGVTLTASNTSDNYDLFLYRDGDGSCSDNPFASSNPSGDERLDHIWNAAGPTQGQTRTLTIEVRKVGASCGAWSMEVKPHPCSNFTAPGGDTCATK